MIEIFTKEQIEQCIIDAEKGISKMTPEAFETPGFTSEKIRHFLNNIGGLPNLHHFEVGVHKGGTFIATNYCNDLVSSVAVDNWFEPEFAQDGLSRTEFLKYTSKLLKPGSFMFYEIDCFTMTKEQLPNPINFYFYDGSHTKKSHILHTTQNQKICNRVGSKCCQI